MVALCFVLDLRSLSPPLLADLKQFLLQLANLYAISLPSRQSNSLRDRIGLCYLLRDRISASDELKVAYTPRGNFSLRDFHHAVNSLPTDAFLPEIKYSGAVYHRDVKLSTVLSDKVLYSWGGKDIMRKAIVLTSSLPKDADSTMKTTLVDAADKCISLEYVLFEQKSNHLGDLQDHINSFIRFMTDLDNCSFQTYLPDFKVFHGLVKRWLQDLKDDMEEQLQARLIFKNNLFGAVNQIMCNLCASINQITDAFGPCQTCRCHGIPLGITVKGGRGAPFCPVTGGDLGTLNVIENSVKVGENTVLFMPSFQASLKLQQLTSPVDFNVIERTPMGSLNEGVVIGASYVVTPSAFHEMEAASDGIDQPELNVQLFRGLCSTLNSLDEGLVCSSNCNMDTLKKAAFHCYYILQPSENGPMLLRRLAGAEEVLPVPDINHFVDPSVSKEIEISVHSSLVKPCITVKYEKNCMLRWHAINVQAREQKLDSRDYNPLLHERGFHQKLNSLVKESLQFGSIPPKVYDRTELSSKQSDTSETTSKSNSTIDLVASEENPRIDIVAAEQKPTTSYIAEEWEQLVVSEMPKKYSPTCKSKVKWDQSLLSPPDTNRQLDHKTSKILERLEAPRQLKTKVVSPTAASSSMLDTYMPMKKPLIPFEASQVASQGTPSSQLMKPNFQRLKRKHK